MFDCFVLCIFQGGSFSILCNSEGRFRTFESQEEAESDRELEECPEAIHIAHIEIYE